MRAKHRNGRAQRTGKSTYAMKRFEKHKGKEANKKHSLPEPETSPDKIRAPFLGKGEAKGRKWLAQHERVKLRNQMADEQGWRCCYCDVGMVAHGPADIETNPTLVTIEHVMPKSLGGTNDPSNLKAACLECNYVRGLHNISAEIFEMRCHNLKEAHRAQRPKNKPEAPTTPPKDTMSRIDITDGQRNTIK